MNLQLPHRHLNVSQIAAVLVLMAFLSFAVQPVSAEHVVMPDGQTVVNWFGIGECGYINMHNRPTGGFVTAAQATDQASILGCEGQPFCGYILMHNR